MMIIKGSMVLSWASGIYHCDRCFFYALFRGGFEQGKIKMRIVNTEREVEIVSLGNDLKQ